jgi:predicted dehydrogenase
MPRQYGRRDLGRGLAATGVATAFTTALGSRRVLGANERIGLGIIGCGNRGASVWGKFLGQPNVDPVAVCDVYQPFVDQGVAAGGGRPRAYQDFRKLLDDKDVDAVIIATPDHWHALQTIAACRAGKDVYVEKPLSLFVKEGTAMLAEARRHKRVVQTGSQQRSGAHYARAVELIRQGYIGPVHHVSVGYTRNVGPGFRAKDLPVNDRNLDWDLWLGPAPKVPFDPFRCLYNFRWFWDYSGGQMTNFGAHHLDIVRWALGARAPLAVSGYGGRYAVKDGGETPDVQEVVYQFPNCVVTWSSREINRGERPFDIEFHGTKATLGITRGGFRVIPEARSTNRNAASARVEEATPAVAPIEEKGVDLDTPHVASFLDSIKTRRRPTADIEDGHLSATMCHLGNAATRLSRSLRWDAEKEQVLDDPAANRWLTRRYRAPWSLDRA